MRIIKFRAENFKRIKAVEISPDGNIVTITGKNDVGKSSVIDAIAETMKGQDRTSPPKPIREGQTRAETELYTDDHYTIKRTWTESSSYLTVLYDGHEVKKPQTVLEDLYGALTFDPLAFDRLDKNKKVDMLLSVLHLPIDPRNIDKDIEREYNERRDINRDLKIAQTKFDAIDSSCFEGLPENRLSLSEIDEEIRKNEAIKDRRREIQSRIDDKVKDAAGIEREILSVQEKIRNLRGYEAELVDQLKQVHDVRILEEQALEKEEPIKEDAIGARLKEIQEINAKIDNRAEYRLLKATIEELAEKSQAKTDCIDELKAEKEKILSEAEMPIDGLGFEDGGVIYNGIPLEQISTSKRVMISTSIAMALNPSFKVLLVRNGNDLDHDTMSALHKMIQDNDYQMWIEVVEDDSETGIVIEDGTYIPEKDGKLR